MTAAGEYSVDKPGFEDPGILHLIHSAEKGDECATAVFDFWLQNPVRDEHLIAAHQCCTRCSNCSPALMPGQELEWIQVNPAPPSASLSIFRSTATEKAQVLEELKKWRLEHWRSEW